MRKADVDKIAMHKSRVLGSVSGYTLQGRAIVTLVELRGTANGRERNSINRRMCFC